MMYCIQEIPERRERMKRLDWSNVMNDIRIFQQNEALAFKAKMNGKKFRHFKGGIYYVLDVAVHSETSELMVIYQSSDTPYIWCRPLDMFLSDVDHEKYPDVTQEKRFELMED